MEKLKPNSYKSKQMAPKENVNEGKHIEKVITSEVRTKKKSGLYKVIDMFIGKDSFDDIRENLATDIRKTVSNALTDTIQTLLVGKPQGSSGAAYRGEKVSYRSNTSYSSGRRSTAHTAYSYEDIFFSTRGEAERVLECMNDIIATYHAVSVADMYDLVGITGYYTDNKYGWTNLDGVQTVRIAGGEYCLKLPPAEPLH